MSICNQTGESKPEPQPDAQSDDASGASQPATLDDLQGMAQAVLTEDPAAQLEAIIRFRKLLSIGTKRLSEQTAPPTCFTAERNPPIQEVISTGVVPRLIQFLKCHEDPQLQVASCDSRCF